MAVHVAPGGEADGPQAKHLIDAQPADRRPDRILGDTAYGNGPVRKELADRDVDVLAPVPEGEVLEGRVGKRDFTIDPAAGTVTCPAGHTATITTSKKGVRTARISAGGVPHLPAEGAVLPRPREPADRARRTRRVDRRCSPSARRSRHGRSPATYPAEDRAAARTARVSIRRTEEPVHRHQESNSAGQLGGRVGEPQPDRPTPRYRDQHEPPGRTRNRPKRSIEPLRDPARTPTSTRTGRQPDRPRRPPRDTRRPQSPHNITSSGAF